MKKYCCYCFRVKKNTTFNSVTEYFSANTAVSNSGSRSDIDDNNVNRNSLLSALYTENPLHEETNHCPDTSVSKTKSLLPPRRNSSDEFDNTDDNTDDNTSTWRVIE